MMIYKMPGFETGDIVNVKRIARDIFLTKKMFDLTDEAVKTTALEVIDGLNVINRLMYTEDCEKCIKEALEKTVYDDNSVVYLYSTAGIPPALNFSTVVEAVHKEDATEINFYTASNESITREEMRAFSPHPYLVDEIYILYNTHDKITLSFKDLNILEIAKNLSYYVFNIKNGRQQKAANKVINAHLPHCNIRIVEDNGAFVPQSI